jgi:DNA-binding transcriptional LysR family regulator
LLDELDADEMDLAIGYDLMLQGQFHHKRRKLFTETWLCMFSAEKTGISPPISLDDYLRFPHVVTSLRPGHSAPGIVDRALDKLGLRRSVALTTSRFLTTPSLVARAPVLVTMQARLARRFAAELGLSLSPPPVDLGEITMALLWHASYDHDPAHTWLRELVIELAAEL